MNSKIETIYYIETGAENKYYTLWVHRNNKEEVKQSLESDCKIRFFQYDKYLRNLSIDKDEAIAKAMEITGLSADQLLVCEHKTGKIIYEEDALRWGKYKDHRVSELEDVKWLNWLAKGGMVPSEQYPDIYVPVSPVVKNPMLIDFAQDRLMQLGEWQNFGGKKVSNAKAELLNKGKQFGESLVFGHHFSNGDKKEARLVLIHQTSYDSMYGTTYIVTFMDVNDKKVYTYKGSSFWFGKGDSHVFNEKTGKEQRTHYIMNVKFTVEHNTYNDIPQSLIRRPKIVAQELITEEEAAEYRNLYSNYKQVLKLA